MALTVVQQNLISRAAHAAKVLIEDIKPVLDEMAYFWDGAPNWHAGGGTTVTDQNLSAVPGFNGITATQLADGLYPMISTIKGALAAGTGYEQIVTLGALAGG